MFDSFKPDIVFHCAAYKHVAPMQRYPREAVNTNILGTINILEQGVKTVFVSSDKAIGSSVMGGTKKIGELLTRQRGGIVVRFGNVLGSRGSVIPLWQESINRGEPLNVTDKRMTRYFMTIKEACELVIEASHGNPGEIYVLDMGEKVNVLDLAEKIIKESGKDIGIKMIGIRPGEQLEEKLMTPEEESRAIKKGKLWIIK